jgi:hypothetical protein
MVQEQHHGPMPREEQQAQPDHLEQTEQQAQREQTEMMEQME